MPTLNTYDALTEQSDQTLQTNEPSTEFVLCRSTFIIRSIETYITLEYFVLLDSTKRSDIEDHQDIRKCPSGSPYVKRLFEVKMLVYTFASQKLYFSISYTF